MIMINVWVTNLNYIYKLLIRRITSGLFGESLKNVQLYYKR